MADLTSTIQNLMKFTSGKKYNTIYADPPWQFQNRTGKVAPEHKRLSRYSTMQLEEIKALPVSKVADEKCHLYFFPMVYCLKSSIVFANSIFVTANTPLHTAF